VATILKIPTSPEVVFSCQPVVDTSIYCIKVEQQVGCCDFVYAVSAIFLLPVWPEMAVSGLFLLVACVLRCVVASRLAQSGMGRQPTTGILLSVHQKDK